MSGEQLREELARLAERAPAVDVPGDLFDRGRRATARLRVLAAVAAAACLALVAGLGWQVAADDDLPVAGGESRGGVPALVHAPPEGVVDLPVTPLAEVGRAAVLYTVDDPEGTVVVVSPEGRYRSVRLPGRLDPTHDELGPVLSPDGSKVAYATQDEEARGLAVADLDSGEVREVALAAAPGALVWTLQWSPDSRSLAWSGQVVTSLRPEGASFGRSVAGVVAPGAAVSTLLPGRGPGRWDGLGSCEDGSAVRYVWPEFTTSAGRAEVRHRSWRRVLAAHGACTPPQSFLPRPLGGFESLLGWVPGADGGRPTAVLLAPRWTDETQESFDGFALRLVGGDSRDVGMVESAWVATVSVATDLMSEERPTVPAGPDPWPTWWEAHGGLVLGGGAALAALLGLVALWRLRTAAGLPLRRRLR